MRLSVPSAPDREVLKIESFRGVDINNAPSAVDLHRSPKAVNITRDTPGSIRKRMGFRSVGKYNGRINGVYSLGGERLVHTGEELYCGEKLIFSGMRNERSTGIVLNDRLYILDGKKALVYGDFDGERQLKTLEDAAYIPTVIISRAPSGGGEVYESVNLLSRAWRESFLGDGSTKKYQLTKTDLAEDEVLVKIMDSNGDWQERTEGKHFTVDREKGIVTFINAPAEPSVTGMDNVEITAFRDSSENADKINKCTIGILYGVNGSCDRLFVSGNPDEPDCDRYSALRDPTYFADTDYCSLGGGDGRIMGYAVINGALAAVRTNAVDGRNIIIRNGTINSSSEVIFPVVNSLIGPGAVAEHGFGYLQSEPLFVTSLGIYAVTGQDISGEKYSQNRSFYINSDLTEEALADCFCFTYRDMLLCAVGERVYVLDGLQRAYESGQPYSSYQYEAYIWEGIGARVMWEEDGALLFGREDGSIMEFYTDKTDPESYNDCGEAIYALWTLPQLRGSTFYRRKVFRNMALSLSSAIRTGGEVYGEARGVRKKLFDSGGEAVYLDFSYIDFGSFNFSSDTTEHSFIRRINIRGEDKLTLSIENNVLNEPFGVRAVAIEYNEGGKRWTD